MKQRGSGKSTFTEEWDAKILMRFNICVGAVKGGLCARKKKKIRVYVCVGAV